MINSPNSQVSTQIDESKRGELSVDLREINIETLGVYEQSTQRFSSNVKIETFDGSSSASYLFDKYGKVYFKVENLLDDVKVASRRPYGARPTKPRQVVLGYKYQF